jgi:hypothetical protein
MKLNKTETLWAAVNSKDEVMMDTLSYFKKDAITKFLIGLSEQSWQYWSRNYGYRCIKVSVTITV